MSYFSRSFSPYHCCLFVLFLISNSILSYTSFPISIKILIVIIGILLPGIGSLFLKKYDRPQPPLTNLEFMPKIPLGVWILLIGLAFFFRFFQLTTYSVWPNYDEGWMGYYAVQLANHWSWDFLYAKSQIPPVYIWILGLFYKFFGSSLQTLWLVPSLLSLLALPIAYRAALAFFSRSFAFLFLVLLALNYWAWYTARLSGPMPKDHLSEFLIFLCLGLFLKAIRNNNFYRNYFWMGVSVGLSYYLLAFHWFCMALFISSIVMISNPAEKQNKLRHLLTYFVPILLFLAPIFWLEWTQKIFQTYYQFIGYKQMSSTYLSIFSNLPYISSLFWGVNPHVWYGPIWGGFFNPILGALFFVGFLELIEYWRQPVYFWLMAGFAIFLVPGFITKGLETFRILMVLPVALAIIAIGSIRLFYYLPNRKSWLLLLLFSGSLLLDMNHFRLYHDEWRSISNWINNGESIERYRAYEILKGTASQNGPGLIFSDFLPGFCDETLSATDGDFNVCENPNMTIDDAHWTAVLANVNYRPFLEKRFGPAKAYALSSDRDLPDGGWMLLIIPLTKKNKPVFRHWMEASRSLMPFIDVNLGHHYVLSNQEYIDALLNAYPHFRNDPFLESCFWEKTAYLYLDIQYQSVPVSHINEDAFQCLQKAVTLGYPSAHLYYRLATLYKINHDEVKAKKVFLQATHCPMNLTKANQFL